MRGSIEEVLNEFGWDNGFKIPVANEENKKIEEEIEKKIKDKKNLIEKLAVNEERIKAVTNYIDNIRIEHEHNQKLLTAYAAQHNAEDHMFRLFEHEESSISQEIKTLEKEKKTSEEKMSSLEAEMTKLEKKRADLEQAMVFDKDKLLEWQEVLNEDQEDEGLIQKYIKLDAKKWKELELKRQKLTVELDIQKSSVIQTMNDICELEIVLDRTAGFYVQALDERRQLIGRWSQSAQVLRHRDNNIEEILREIDTLREVAKDNMETLTEAESFLENQKECNRQLELSIKFLEKKLASDREERQRLMENNRIYELEYQTRKKSLEELSRRFQRLKTEMRGLNADLDSKRKKLIDWAKQIEEIKASITEVEDQSVSTADRLQQLEDMLETEEKRKSAIIREIKRFQDFNLLTSNKITEFDGERKSVEFQKAAELKKIEIFRACQGREEQTLDEKKQLSQQLDFEIKKCEMQLGKSSPDDSKRAELERKNKLIKELEKTLEEKMEVSKLLQTQLMNLENDVRKIQGSLKTDNEHLQRLHNKKQDAGLMIDGGEKQLKAAQRINEEKQVAENILELRVTQAEELFRNIGNKLYDLEKYHLQIDSAMQERMSEIKLQKDGLTLEKRFAVSQCSELRAAIAERQSKIQHLQLRYDNIISAVNGSGDGTLPLSTAYLKIQNAQEKAQLQEEGDKLDATIRRTEQEIQSMENTLRIVNACNEKYKLALDTTCGVGDDEYDNIKELERKQLDEEMLSAVQMLKLKKIELEEAENEFQRLQEELERILEDVVKIKEEKEIKLQAVASIEKQIGEQNERNSRAEKSLKKLYKDIQKACENADDYSILLQEKDIATRELQEQNMLALQRITEFTIRHLEAEVYVKKLLSQKNISLPCAQHLKPSPTPSLCESSTKSSLTSSVRSRITSRESLGRVHNISSEFLFQTSGGRRKSTKK